MSTNQFISDGVTGGPKRGPGRPPKSVASPTIPPASVVPPGAPTSDTVDRPAKRVRKPFGSHSQKLAHEQRPGYRRYWFNDVPGRLQVAVEAGYDHVKEPSGETVKRPVGTNQQGGVLLAYLMEIPQAWFDEDMTSQQDEVRKSEQAIAGGVVLDSQGERQGVFTNTAQGRRTSIRHGER